LFPGGKRLRPLFALLGAKVTGGDPARVLPSAAGLELLHTYSLVHDDLPCMDDDDLRRGRLTCHRVFGEATAMLVGDALLTLAFAAVATGGADAVRVLAAAPADRTPSRLAWIHDHKTGALITASLLVGAYAGGGALATLEHLRAYGERVGRAFQIADDCLDVTGTTEKLGKRPGQDEAQRKLTYPAVMGLSASMEIALNLAREAEELATAIVSGAPGGLESDAALLIDAARSAVSRIT
jgi:geranylgeranyl diphosphate synthase type II